MKKESVKESTLKFFAGSSGLVGKGVMSNLSGMGFDSPTSQFISLINTTDERNNFFMD